MRSLQKEAMPVLKRYNTYPSISRKAAAPLPPNGESRSTPFRRVAGQPRRAKMKVLLSRRVVVLKLCRYHFKQINLFLPISPIYSKEHIERKQQYHIT
jgi:hypothetical protein